MTILKKVPGSILIFLGAVCLSFGGIIVKSFDEVVKITLEKKINGIKPGDYF